MKTQPKMTAAEFDSLDEENERRLYLASKAAR
jgi:hypothetical protein